jgi:hypothetical protein
LLPGGGACDIANAWPCRCVQPNGTTLHFPSPTRGDFVIDACAHLYSGGFFPCLSRPSAQRDSSLLPRPLRNR